MNSFATVADARAYAASKPAVTHILHIRPAKPDLHPYICTKCDADTMRFALARKPMPEIADIISVAVDLLAERRAVETRRDREVWQAEVVSGRAIRTAEIAEQYGGSLSWAVRMRPEDRAQWAEWYWDVAMFGLAGDADRVTVDSDAIRQVVGNRRSDGQFPGCTNYAWTITEAEWQAILIANAEITQRKAGAHTRNAADEVADIKRKRMSGYCAACESYCHGDCGAYRAGEDVSTVLAGMQREWSTADAWCVDNS